MRLIFSAAFNKGMFKEAAATCLNMKMYFKQSVLSWQPTK